MKKIVLSFTVLLSGFSFAQTICCNVVDSAGTPVVSSNGLCVVAPNLPSGANCGEKVMEEAVVEEIMVKETVEEEAMAKEAMVEEKLKIELKEEEKAILTSALEGVKFKTNSDVLLPDSYPKLDAVAELMESHKDYKLTIDGYTDNTGDSAHNHELSLKRAEAAKARLIEDGISADRITTHGYGEERPIATNDTQEGRAKNRRVEFLISL